MREGIAQAVRRADYAAPAYWIRSVELTFDLDPVRTIVASRMAVQRNATGAGGALRLHGEDLEPLRVLANGQSVSFRVEGGELVIDNPPEGDFTLEIRNTCAPEKNTQLSGLYTSGGGFFTQCEAEGFRRITYFPDRPDVLAVYTINIIADKAANPLLLSNGNFLGGAGFGPDKHFAAWFDPHPKPSYLFALVAGDLGIVGRHLRQHFARDSRACDKRSAGKGCLGHAQRFQQFKRFGFQAFDGIAHGLFPRN